MKEVKEERKGGREERKRKMPYTRIQSSVNSHNSINVINYINRTREKII